VKNPSRTVKIYLGLVVCLALLAAMNVFLPQGALVPIQALPVPRPLFAIAVAIIVLLIYGGLGLLGLMLSHKLGFTDLWATTVSIRQRLLIPALIGAILGVLFVLADAVFVQFHTLGPIPHPPFPTSLIASASAGIGEELIFRLFFISFWVWLVSEMILKRKWQNQVFWIVAVGSAFAFALAHVPSIMFLFGMKSIEDVPLALMSEILLLNGVLSLVAAYYFKTYGFLAAISVHFWADVVWHVIWGALSASARAL
jgi:membrane protease YdiL (CAAX protease family)